ncbi:hypothetical protein KUCAC02_019360 [Chaenocephalus aceratus]|uniref:Uncharacterized protein n=1 Tax=Chaenocephalus aceratus TaxID=36190 RepID=A0ACB9VNU6_CHAAC|nr:hypothetical protein KUCAC02_019360 [Chaenocephalus aceratus]
MLSLLCHSLLLILAQQVFSRAQNNGQLALVPGGLWLRGGSSASGPASVARDPSAPRSELRPGRVWLLQELRPADRRAVQREGRL